MKVTSIIPTRFLSLIAHLLVAATLLWSRDRNVKACLPLTYSMQQYEAKDTQLILGLSLSLGLISLELIGFFSGISMFANLTSLTSILGHCGATIGLTYFVLDEWDCDLYWWIFALGSVLPAILESAVIIQFAISRR